MMATAKEAEARDTKIAVFRLLRFVFVAMLVGVAYYWVVLPILGAKAGVPVHGYGFIAILAGLVGGMGSLMVPSAWAWILLPVLLLILSRRKDGAGLDVHQLAFGCLLLLPFTVALLLLLLLRRSGKWPIVWM